MDIARESSHSAAVRIPMMPKGVEHCFPATASTKESSVRIPMMPKGVEHTNRLLVVASVAA